MKFKNVNCNRNYFKLSNWRCNWVSTFKRCVTVPPMSSRLLLNSKSNFQALRAKLSKNWHFNHMPKQISNLESTRQNEFESVLGLWFSIGTPVGQCPEKHANSTGPVSNHNIFTVTKHIQYIFHIEDNEM